MEVSSIPRQGTPQTLLAAVATQRMLILVRTDFETALLQARRDGWSLRVLAEHLSMSYTSVKRYSERAEARGQ